MKFTQEIIPANILEEILNSPIPYTDEDEQKTTENLLKTLSPEDVITAAEGSYAYWVAKHSNTPPTEEQTIRMATRECRRHIFKVKYDDAVVNIKETCRYRKERRIELFRAAFTLGVEFDNEEDQKLVEKLRDQIRNDLQKQHAYVRGKDKEGRALLLLKSRTDKNTVDEEFIAMLIYIMERAVAATEYVSRGLQEKILVVLDFGDFTSSLSPPFSAVKAISSILQTKYSERLKNLVIIDPPFWMRTMYGMIKPFLDPVTKAKFIVASGAKQKNNVVSEKISADQAVPWLLPDGQLTVEVDLEHMLNAVPFHCLYDDAK